MKDVKVDSAAFLKGLSELEQKQFPFAYAKTLTDCAKLGQDVGRRKTREVFELHTEFIPSQIVVKPAKAADVKVGRAVASVQGTEKIGFMTIHETGGTKLPKGSALAIPTFSAQRNIPGLRTRTGRIAPRFQPKRVLEGWPPGVNRGYVQDGLVFKRLTKRAEPTPLFDFERSARIKPEWKFEQSVRGAVFLQASSFFRRNLAMALATMRK